MERNPIYSKVFMFFDQEEEKWIGFCPLLYLHADDPDASIVVDASQQAVRNSMAASLTLLGAQSVGEEMHQFELQEVVLVPYFAT